MTFDRFVSLVGLIGAVTVLVIAFRLDPDPRGTGTHEQLGMAPCGFLDVHGVPCISCGMTTAFAAMAEARVGLAMRANPFGAFLFLVVLAAPFHFARTLLTGADPLAWFRSRRAAIVLPALGGLLLANWGVMVLLAKRGS